MTRLRSTTYSTFLTARRHHAGELDLADAERAALARRAEPAEEEAGQLPQRVEAEAARHHRIAVEMAGEEPQVGLDIEFGHDSQPLPCSPPVSEMCGDAVEHQHRRQRQLGVARAEQLAAPAGQQLLVNETAICAPPCSIR